MIVIVTSNKELNQTLQEELSGLNVPFELISPDTIDVLGLLYRDYISALVVDDQLPSIPRAATVDLVNGLSKRVPVVVVQSLDTEIGTTTGIMRARNTVELSDAVTVVRDSHAATILATLDVCGALGTIQTRNWHRAVSYYNPHIPTRMLVENGGLGVLTIDASSFRKIEVEYGTEVYSKVKEMFQSLLNEMWGKPGCFRATDILCKRSDHGNHYYVFLNRSRTTGALPLPGILEVIADRLARIIQNAIYAELFMPKDSRRLPACIHTMPKVVVGYGSAIHNPCLNPLEVISSAIDSSSRAAAIQSVRNLDRSREMMETLIQSSDLLVPHFQAVFRLPQLTRAMVDEMKKLGSFSPLRSILFGFESLIRVRTDQMRSLIGTSRAIIDPAYLRPDVLFDVAKSTKVALELDQACLKLAIQHGKNLPGALMINILPRNLYYIRYLQDLLNTRGNIILEVSESETINNFELIHEIHAQVGEGKLHLAADDFGRAFAGLDRVIQMRPQIIKFDRSLVEDIHVDKVKFAYVKGLVDAAAMLKTEVLAEGVELWEEAETLQSLGIHYIQGFLLHRSESVERITEQLNETTVNQGEQSIPTPIHKVA